MTAANDAVKESPEEPAEETKERKNWRSDLWAAFKNVAIVFSFAVNFVLVLVILLIAGWLLFPAKTDLVEPILDDLQGAINALDSATIVRTIDIDQNVPVGFTLPVKQSTTVVLTQDVPLVRPATFVFPSGGGAINGTVSLSLPQGMALPVYLEMDVPVDTSIAVAFPVEVEIPLNETELNRVVVELNDVLGPVRELVDGLPDSYSALIKDVQP
jgi:hypothetical protein